ncbi:39S ribosomal protein L54, mitochondrial [Schistocerca americana]|uniref:39S ribosomal protein L54, mitochondrial n=1 Tax=Schistocerca americana TaxID=7009 RepID=UPI001F50402E|nr:39S ribosomal protein L54, mitochondrial [Schistocerca americana]XP_047114843.1 39S ribosomal protein L54, mitochondrial [Schistocerca piceifrons]XP_049812732.1 39S ribosomal protein L54, mitochondrial [Schistocerca nitens]XP_049961206.1 39S ribosomal protein L54, mitochondrial [Schistocerca serialis cubense]XP_049961207.1 39S ribosomal protein L54, mitochondrial [Schistocerca serialis cubense]
MNICRNILQRRSCFLINNLMYSKKAEAGATIAGLGKRKKLGKLGPVMEKKVLPVETDPARLVSYVCGSNIYKEGEDIKLKEDSEYPDWLWNIRTGKPPALEELDPNTKEYWRRLRKMALRRNNQLQKIKKF